MSHNSNEFVLPLAIPSVIQDPAGNNYQIAVNPDDAKHIYIMKPIKIDLMNDEDLQLLRDIDPDWTDRM